MPYIKKKFRPTVNAIVEDMMGMGIEPDGQLNYLLYKFCKEWIKVSGESYNHYKDFLGELDCAKLEIYRRLVAPYEDKKKKENGDV